MLTQYSLQHKFGVELKDGTKQTRLSTLVEYGSSDPNGYSAMAKLGKCIQNGMINIQILTGNSRSSLRRCCPAGAERHSL